MYQQAEFDFIIKASGLVYRYSQFTEDLCIWIACQFALESSFGKSPLARDNQNYCGMRNPLVRISSAICAGDGNYLWARYVNFDACVVDYLLGLQYHRPLSCDYDSIAHFSKFISKIYYHESDYIDKINFIYQQFKSQQNEFTI